MHPYTNMPDDGFEVVADNYIEASAEKFCALAGRTRLRDLIRCRQCVSQHRCPEAAIRRSLMSCAKNARSKTSRFPRLADLQLHRVDVEAGWDHLVLSDEGARRLAIATEDGKL
jgi:hypothetical protein